MQETTQERVDFCNYLLVRGIVFGNLEIEPQMITPNFLHVFEHELDFYKENECLSHLEKRNIGNLFNFIRFKKEFSDPLEKEKAFDWCNRQIEKMNSIGDRNYESFMINQLQEYDPSYTKPSKRNQSDLKINFEALRICITEEYIVWSNLISSEFYEEKQFILDLVKDSFLEQRIDAFMRKYPQMLDDRILGRLKNVLSMQKKILENISKANDTFKFQVNIHYEDGSKDTLIYQLAKEDFQKTKENIDIETMNNTYAKLEQFEPNGKHL